MVSYGARGNNLTGYTIMLYVQIYRLCKMIHLGSYTLRGVHPPCLTILKWLTRRTLRRTQLMVSVRISDEQQQPGAHKEKNLHARNGAISKYAIIRQGARHTHQLHEKQEERRRVDCRPENAAHDDWRQHLACAVDHFKGRQCLI